MTRPSTESGEEPLFDLVCPFEPMGDQPAAIEQLSGWIQEGHARQCLLGITGSGKTYTMAGQDADAAAYHPACFDGVIPRAVRYIFEQVEERRATAK